MKLAPSGIEAICSGRARSKLGSFLGRGNARLFLCDGLRAEIERASGAGIAGTHAFRIERKAVSHQRFSG
jgi:hypothetical protein